MASDEIIKAAIEAIEHEGLDWVPNGRRVQPPDDDDKPESENVDVKTLHAEMLARIDTLEQALERISKPGIGHNQPPEPLEEEPLTAVDFQALSNAISILKAQPVEPANMPTEAIEAENTLQNLIKKTTTYLAQKGDLFITEAVKAAGSETGKLVPRLAFWAFFADALVNAGHAVAAWLHTVHLPF
ncbi:MAG: hypothetical protein L0Y60_11630 [Beijerinckiaceae bacterium]|nr:hypothetical protein [Beijerinckiaceae bacterium]